MSAQYIESDRGFETPCWVWQGAKNPQGYGQIRRGGRLFLTVRFNYEDRHGPVPEGLELDHLCRVRACVNPDHVEPVTHAENCRRGERTKLTPDDVALIRRGVGTQRELGRIFGVAHTTIGRVRRGEGWVGV